MVSPVSSSKMDILGQVYADQRGLLHSIPASVCKSILSKAVKSGLIAETEDGFKATELGIGLLMNLDSCPTCRELRLPYHTTSHYVIPGRSAQHYELGIRYICKHGIQEAYRNQQGSNIGRPINHSVKFQLAFSV